MNRRLFNNLLAIIGVTAVMSIIGLACFYGAMLG